MLKNITSKKKVKQADGTIEERVGSVNYDFGDNLKDAVAKHDEAVVFSNYKANGTIVIQAGIRRMLETGKSQDEITAKFSGYKLGTAMDRSIDIEAAFMSKWASMSAEEKRAKLAELKAAG